jgi:hypothetical protein
MNSAIIKLYSTHYAIDNYKCVIHQRLLINCKEIEIVDMENSWKLGTKWWCRGCKKNPNSFIYLVL